MRRLKYIDDMMTAYSLMLLLDFPSRSNIERAMEENYANKTSRWVLGLEGYLCVEFMQANIDSQILFRPVGNNVLNNKAVEDRLKKNKPDVYARIDVINRDCNPRASDIPWFKKEVTGRFDTHNSDLLSAYLAVALLKRSSRKNIESVVNNAHLYKTKRWLNSLELFYGVEFGEATADREVLYKIVEPGVFDHNYIIKEHSKLKKPILENIENLNEKIVAEGQEISWFK